MKHLKIVARKHTALIAVFIVMGLVWTFLQNFVPLYFQTVVDNFTDGSLSVANIVVYGVALLGLYIMGYLTNYPWDKLSRSIAQSLKLTALRKISVIDYQTYTKLGTGSLIQRIENGASAGKSILFDFYLRLIGELLPSMIFSIVFVFIINRTVMAVIVLGYLIVFAVSNLLLKILYKVKERILVNEERFNHFLVRGFMEMVTFRINRRFNREIQKAKDASQEIVSSAVKIRMVHEAFFTIFAILVGFVKIGIIIYGWNTGALTIGQIVALMLLVDNAYQPIAIFNVDYVAYKLDKIAFARYTQFLDGKEDSRLLQGDTVSTLEGSISFSEVSFNYGEREIFTNFNLNIEKGKNTAFVGESGSGKSTAVRLMAGLLQPSKGTITVDNFDLNKTNLNSYYKHIAYLQQEPSVFDGTLRENLVFDETVDNAQLINAIAKAGLDGLFAKLEKGLDTPLGEKGISLSGGERQQLALARLWFSKAQIVILDEATSAIDNLTEESVIKNVMKELEGKTVIAVAHRLDSIKTFDKILLFQDGQITEQGNFTDLLNKQQSFYDLYNRAQQNIN
ncbi:MAG: ABC transporter ATP-binding protein/permease [Defluviitaleaceae bacterium]|nr:ABC transporter ATP-binding protein/permease [Defluviitaleaceae bacterium]